MHNIYDSDNIVNRDIVESAELLGRECAGCLRILHSNRFRRDSSTKDGRAIRCTSCESAPALSINENTSMLRERNNNSDAIKKLRPVYMDSMRCDLGRIGKVMWAEDFLSKLQKLLPGLRWIPGKIEGDISVYLLDNRPEFQPLGYRYLWYVESGVMPEFSLWEFDARDFPIKEKKRGWRTPLLRCILAGLISEQQADDTFGRTPESLVSEVWYRRLYAHRNQCEM
jgi:hypothetical protein